MELKLTRNQEHNMQPSLVQYSPIVSELATTNLYWKCSL